MRTPQEATPSRPRRRVPPSNRRGTPSLSEGPGIDRLSVSFPVSSFDNDPHSWDRVSTSAPRDPGGPWLSTYQRQVTLTDGVTAFVGVSAVPQSGDRGIGWWGKVELNPSRVVDPDGWSLATVPQAVNAVATGVTAAGELMRCSGELDQLRVKRIDVARDFKGLDRPAATIRALAPVHRPWAKRNLVHSDPTRNGAQTLMVGSGAGVVRLYDKAAETGGKAPEGTVRWEAECRPGWANNYGGIKTMADVSELRVQGLALDRFQWSGVGVEVSGTSRVVEVVCRSGLTEREQATFLGWLMMAAHGQAWHPGSSATLAKYRAVQRTLGIALDDLGSDDSGQAGFVTRLDWQSGREVARVA